MAKKWVFEALVQDDKDAVGLIAYALYKHRKHTLAGSLRAEGKSEQDIESEVRMFHDHTLNDGTLDDYREKATRYLDGVYASLETDIKANFEKEKQKLVKAHAAELKKDRAKFVKNVRAFETSNQNWLERFWLWLLSGIPSLVSTFVLTAFLWGALFFFVSEDAKKELVTNLVTSYLGVDRVEAHDKP